jgi:hypothetical protein
MTDIVIRGPVTMNEWERCVLYRFGNGHLVAWAAREAIRAAAAEPVRRAVSRILERWAAGRAHALHRQLIVPLPAARLYVAAVWRRGPPRLAAAPETLVTDP